MHKTCLRRKRKHTRNSHVHIASFHLVPISLRAENVKLPSNLDAIQHACTSESILRSCLLTSTHGQHWDLDHWRAGMPSFPHGKGASHSQFLKCLQLTQWEPPDAPFQPFLMSEAASSSSLAEPGWQAGSSAASHTAADLAAGPMDSVLPAAVAGRQDSLSSTVPQSREHHPAAAATHITEAMPAKGPTSDSGPSGPVSAGHHCPGGDETSVGKQHLDADSGQTTAGAPVSRSTGRSGRAARRAATRTQSRSHEAEATALQGVAQHTLLQASEGTHSQGAALSGVPLTAEAVGACLAAFLQALHLGHATLQPRQMCDTDVAFQNHLEHSPAVWSRGNAMSLPSACAGRGCHCFCCQGKVMPPAGHWAGRVKAVTQPRSVHACSRACACTRMQLVIGQVGHALHFWPGANNG